MSWKIDPAHTHINFSVRHMMVANVKGEFTSFDGNIVFDPEKPEESTVELVIDAASISTRVEDRDNHLRSADFFDVENHPHIVFKSTEVNVLNDTEAELKGELTIRDETHPITFEVELQGVGKSPYGQTVAGFEASGKLNRTKWGLNWNQALETGGIMVGEDIKLGIDIELVEVAETAEA